MKMRQHYIALRGALPQLQEHEPYEVTTLELAAALDCTHRNMVLLLQRMQREGWLSWEPRRGRSNRSVLNFLAKKEELVLLEAQEIAQKQDLQMAISYLQTMDSEGTRGLRSQFQDWLSKRFGFHSEVLGERRLDILRFPLPQTIHSLDPASIHYSGESHLVNQLFDGLVRMSPSGDTILPHLAHTWDVDATRTSWTFFLRKGVLFHHGREMVAADVLFTFERLKDLAPRGLYNWVYMGIVSIEMPDERSVRFVLEQRNEALLPFLATNRASIVPAPEVSPSTKKMTSSPDRFTYAEFGLQPIGTGPFRLVDREHGVMVLEAFPAYFQGRGFLDRVEVWTQPLEQELGGQAEQPTFQVMHNVRISETATEQWQQVRQSGTTCKFLTVNELREGPLANAAVREAFDLALNRAEIIERLSGDVIEPADSFWTPHSTSSHTNKSAAADNVEQCLMEAGYNGEPIILATIPQYEADARIVQQVCALAGITLMIKFIPAEQFKGEERLHADLLLFAIMLDEHRELRLIDLFKSMQLHMRPDMQVILEQQLNDLLSESDPKRRSDQFRQIEQQLAAAHSLMFLYRKHLKTAFHPSIRGISLESLGWVHFRDLWFTRLPE